MKSPRQQRNEARRARHRAADATAAFESEQDVARRTREASDAARLSRFEVQGRGYRPIFARTISIGAPVPGLPPALIGGGQEAYNENARVAALVKESKARGLGGDVS